MASRYSSSSSDSRGRSESRSNGFFVKKEFKQETFKPVDTVRKAVKREYDSIKYEPKDEFNFDDDYKFKPDPDGKYVCLSRLQTRIKGLMKGTLGPSESFLGHFRRPKF